MSSRIALMLSPLLFLVPARLIIAHTTSYLVAMLVSLAATGVIVLLVSRYAEMNHRDDFWWGAGAFLFPFIAPVILALLPASPLSAHSQLRQSARDGRCVPARSTRGSFEERFPLLMQCLSGQPEATRAGLQAYYEPVKANFEFLLPADPNTVTRLLAEAQSSGFVLWTGASGNVPIVYGAGMIRPNAVEAVGRWLAAAGAPGHKLTMAFRDETGSVQFSERVFEQASAAGA